MSRSGYSDDWACTDWEMIHWRGAVASATRGRRGQKLLKDLLAGLDAMPEKRLISGDLINQEGDFCALGVVGHVRGLDVEVMKQIEPEPENAGKIAGIFDIAKALAKEIMYENDEGAYWAETPEQRWSRMRAWVAEQINEH